MVTWVTQEMLYNGDDDITNKLVPSLYPYTTQAALWFYPR